MINILFNKIKNIEIKEIPSMHGPWYPSSYIKKIVSENDSWILLNKDNKLIGAYIKG